MLPDDTQEMQSLVAKRRVVFAAIVAAVAVALVGLWVLRQPAPLAVQAREFLEAGLYGDTNVLWERSVEKWRGDTGLTQQGVEEVWRDLIKPRLTRFPKRSAIECNPPVNAFQGSAQVRLETADGKVGSIHLVVTTEGGGSAVGMGYVGSLLCQAWMLDYIADGGDVNDPSFKPRAKLNGLMKDRATLEGLGIRGLAPADPAESVNSWDELIEAWSSHLGGPEL